MIKTAFRAAMIGGPALGALLAGAVASTNRPLLGISDVPLLWLYFTVLAVIVLFMLDLAAATLVTILARQRGLDMKRFDACLHAKATDHKVQIDLAAGEGFKVRGTPSFFMGGPWIQSAWSWMRRG